MTRKPRLVDDLALDLEALRLAPELEALLDEKPLHRLLDPDLFALDAPTLLSLTPQPAHGTAGAPKPGDTATVVKAILAQPSVKALVAAFESQLRKDARDIAATWTRASTGEKVLMVAAALLVGGGFAAAVAGTDPLRKLALDALKGSDIPVPGALGFSLKVLDRGAALTLPTAVPGMKLTVEAMVPREQAEVGVMLTLDLMKLVEHRRSSPR